MAFKVGSSKQQPSKQNNNNKEAGLVSQKIVFYLYG